MRDDVVTVTGPEQALAHYVRLYDEALPHVYGYVHRRVATTATAEDVTAEAFLAALRSVRTNPDTEITIPWLIGVARHKVADHWRREERESRRRDRLRAQPTNATDPWNVVLDAHLAQHTLSSLSVPHRAALSLRYLDGLPVAEVAKLLGRTTGGTEALLTRAKRAFRSAYPSEDSPDANPSTSGGAR